MAKIRALFHGVNSKILLIVSGAMLGSFALFLWGAFYIEALMLVWNFAFVASVIVWERHKRSLALSGGSLSFSNDERWSRTKRDLEKIEGKLDKTRDSEKRRTLLYQKHALENELRRVEWSVKESNLNAMFNAVTGSLRKVDSKKYPIRYDGEGNPEIPEGVDPLDKYTPEGALRERKRLEKLAEERKNVDRIVDGAILILKSEPPESVPEALRSLANEFRANYNILKKQNRIRFLADYWVAWAIMSSIINRVKIDSRISKYASEDFRPRLLKLIKLAEALPSYFPIFVGEGEDLSLEAACEGSQIDGTQEPKS
ncbi:MAG TPA: hypothetical protein VJN71_00995 [Nitrososphaerales archaeon]|nr:hypothetical protein [Nitrososphaerales archaeon]